MGKQAINEVLSYPAALTPYYDGGYDFKNIYSTSYTVPANKRLVFKIIIPYSVARFIHKSITTELTNPSIVSFDIPGVTNIHPVIDASVAAYSGPRDISTNSAILIAKPGTEIKIKLLLIQHSSSSMVGSQIINDERMDRITNFAYINGFLEDDI